MKLYKNLLLDEVVNLLLSKEKTLSEVTRNYPESLDLIIERLHELGYYAAKKGSPIQSVINIKNAAEYYKEQGGYPNVTVTEVGKKFKVAPTKLSSYLNDYYPDVITKKTSTFNENVFDSIDTEEKAYWLGFIFADGTISSSPLRGEAKTQYQFELCLSSKDKGHLEKFSKFIEFRNNIFCDDVRCRLSVYSKHFWNVLNCNGCTPNKSLTLKFPKKELFADHSLIRHFIRGYFDGDGCISYSNKEHTMCSFNLIGTSDFLENVKLYLNLDCSLYILHPEKQSITKYITLSHKKAFKAIEQLYNDSSIYLERKYKRYLEYCRLYEKSDRLSETKIMEGCDANHEVNSETKESESPQRVGIEPEKSE